MGLRTGRAEHDGPHGQAVTRATPRDVSCPWCGASVGSPCVVPNGPGKFQRTREVVWFHDARQRKWEEQNETTAPDD